MFFRTSPALAAKHENTERGTWPPASVPCPKLRFSFLSAISLGTNEQRGPRAARFARHMLLRAWWLAGPLIALRCRRFIRRASMSRSPQSPPGHDRTAENFPNCSRPRLMVLAVLNRIIIASVLSSHIRTTFVSGLLLFQAVAAHRYVPRTSICGPIGPVKDWSALQFWSTS